MMHRWALLFALHAGLAGAADAEVGVGDDVDARGSVSGFAEDIAAATLERARV